MKRREAGGGYNCIAERRGKDYNYGFKKRLESDDMKEWDLKKA
jgi:hypothetical protein